MTDSQTRKSWADLCRVLAIFGVIVIHACGNTFYKFGKIPETDWLIVNFIDSLVRCSVPIFVLLSGALLLNRDQEPVMLHQVLKRVMKVAVPLLAWNIAYLFYISHFTHEPIDWLSMLKIPPMYHLWFVYMIIGLYLLLPVLQILFKAMVVRRDIQLYILVFWFVATCVPVYNQLPLLSLLQLTNFLGYGGYFLIGGIIAYPIEGRKRSTLFWIGIYFVAVAVTFWLTWKLSEQIGLAAEKAYYYLSPNVFFASIAAFIVLTRTRINNFISKILHWTSDRIFLIFFMHVVVLERVQNKIISLKMAVPLSFEIILVSMITFALCLAIASVLRLLPKSKILLG